MSKEGLPQVAPLDATGLRVAVVTARWNTEICEQMRARAVAAAEEAGVELPAQGDEGDADRAGDDRGDASGRRHATLVDALVDHHAHAAVDTSVEAARTAGLGRAGAFVNAWPGIALHIVVIPPVVLALRKAKLLTDSTAEA